MRLFPLFLLWPLVEIALFVTVGGAIGLLWTLVVIFGSGVLGLWLLRRGGVKSAAEMRRGLHVVRGGLGKVADEVLVMLAGVLLILPGFLTDAIGLLLLIKPVRALIMLWAAGRVADKLRAAGHPVDGRAEGLDRGFGANAQARGRPDMIIDGEYIEVESDPRHPPSGWTRH